MSSKQLRLFSVESSAGVEAGNCNTLELILFFANRYGWRPTEVERIIDLGVGQRIVIEELTIERTR